MVRKIKRLPPGPSDNETIAGNDWYLDLVAAGPGPCGTLREAALAGVADARNSFGQQTSPLYLAAAEACLGHWAEAEKAISLQPGPPKSSPCGKLLVYDWVQALLSAHRSNAGFVPVFEDAAPAPACS